MIDFGRKLIFVHLAKTAGSSIEAALLNDSEILDHVHPDRTRKLFLQTYKKNFCGLFHPHATLKNHQEALGDQFKEYKVFTVIRNPWEAAFSHFCYVFKHKEKKFFNKENFRKFISFYEVIKYEHLIGFDGDPYVDFVLNYSDIENEFNQMFQDLKLPGIKIPHGNTSVSSVLNYKEFYTEETKKWVKDIFWYDIARFGWDFETEKVLALPFKKLSYFKKCFLNFENTKRQILSKLSVLFKKIDRRMSIYVQRIFNFFLKTKFKERVTAVVCTHPPALSGLRISINTIIDQVDQIYVYLNNIESVPSWLNNPKIEVVLSKDALGDLKSNGGHYFANKIEGYYFSIDDDIVYPPDYVKKMINKIEAYKRKALICVHAAIIPYHFTSYYLSQIYLGFDRELREDLRVDMGSSGTMAFHTDTIKFELKDFPKFNMTDIYLTFKANRKNVPIISVQRRKYWLYSIPGERSHSIFFNQGKYDEEATFLIKENYDLFKQGDLFYSP